VFWYSVTDKISLLPAFPDYSHGTEIESIQPISDNFRSDLLDHYCGETTVGKMYKAFATMDNNDQILDFYRKAAKNIPNNELREIQGRSLADIEAGYPPETNAPGQIVTCFIGDRHRSGSPVNVVVIYEAGITNKYKDILQIFPNTPFNNQWC